MYTIKVIKLNGGDHVLTLNKAGDARALRINAAVEVYTQSGNLITWFYGKSLRNAKTKAKSSIKNWCN